MKYFICALIGYFIGAINPAYFIGKIKGRDIRKEGSHNAGGSNALIIFGKAVGFFCIAFSIDNFCIHINTSIGNFFNIVQ